jgi:tripartite-type tricarboxylate transporter receptor subunit TctC
MRLLWILLIAFAGWAHAAETGYPLRPVRLIVPWPPGGGADVIARVISQKLSAELGQQVVVDNRGGASTIIGMDLLARSAPDGHTIGFPTSNLAVNPALYSKLPFDPARDFAPVTLAVNGLYVLVVHPSVQAKSVSELIGLARSAPGKLNVALAGPGTPTHLAMAQFNSLAGVTLTGIQYKGAAPAATAVVGGETQMMFTSYPTVAPHVQSGRLRMLAVTSAQRSAAAPDVPTATEAGLPGFVFGEWYGVVAPARTGVAQISRLYGDLRKVLAQPDVKERLAALGADVVASGPAEFGAFIRSEIAKWGKIVKDTGIKAE